MRRLLRLSRTLLVALVVSGAAYLALVNGALIALKQIANRTPDRLFVDYRATTVVPGVFHVRDFTLRMEDRFTQWELRVDRAKVLAHLPALVRRTFDVRSVDAEGVRFRLRRKQLPDELAPGLSALQPPIPGFGPAVRDDDRFPLLPVPAHPWTVQMQNVTAAASELWVDAHRYEGTARATGAWRLQIANEAEISPATLELSHGRLTQGDTVIAERLNGTVTMSVGPFPARRPTPADVLERTDVSTRLAGDVSNESDWLRSLGISAQLLPAWQAGRFTVDARLDAGRPVVGSRIEAELTRVQTSFGGLRAQADAHVALQTRAEGRHTIQVSASGVDLSLARGGGVIADGGSVRLSGAATGGRINELKLPTDVVLRLRAARVPDVRILNEIIPEPMGLSIRRGRATVDGRFALNLETARASGSVSLRAPGLSLQHRQQQFRGNLEATVRVRGLDHRARSVDLSGTRVAVDSVRHASSPKARPWAGAFEVVQGRIELDRREVFSGTVRANLHDARPLFSLLLEGTKTPRWSRRLLAPNHVRATGTVGLGPGWVRLDAVDAKVGRTQVRAVARLDRRQVDLASEVSLGPLRAGIYQQDGSRHLKVFPKRTWFAEHRARVKQPPAFLAAHPQPRG